MFSKTQIKQTSEDGSEVTKTSYSYSPLMAFIAVILLGMAADSVRKKD